MQSCFVAVDGLRIHYWQAGTQGSPVLLLHGGGTDSARLSWEPMLTALAANHRVFAPDMPGYGESQFNSTAACTLADYPGFVAHFMDALGLERASLGGISMGGGISLGLCLTYPQRVDRLVLINSYGLQDKAPYAFLSYLMVQMPWLIRWSYASMRSSRWMARWALRSIFYSAQAMGEDLVDQVFEAIKHPLAGEVFHRFQSSELLPSRLRTVYMPRLGEIQQPVLLIHGQNDTLVPVRYARMAHERLPDSRLEVIPQCGHWAQREKPELVNRLVTDFLGGSGG